jgi:hypothetical protein
MIKILPIKENLDTFACDYSYGFIPTIYLLLSTNKWYGLDSTV